MPSAGGSNPHGIALGGSWIPCEKGRSIREAAVEAGRLRLRPILMTTLTTILGLLPLALGLGAGASMQAARGWVGRRVEGLRARLGTAAP